MCVQNGNAVKRSHTQHTVSHHCQILSKKSLFIDTRFCRLATDMSKAQSNVSNECTQSRVKRERRITIFVKNSITRLSQNIHASHVKFLCAARTRFHLYFAERRLIEAPRGLRAHFDSAKQIKMMILLSTIPKATTRNDVMLGTAPNINTEK